MKKVLLLSIVAIVATGLGLNAQEPPQSPASPAVKQTPADEKAIKVLLDAFTKAFNAGDANATAATYTETAIVVDDQGQRTEGRAAIRDLYADSFANHPGSTIAIQVDSLKFLSPDTALEEGRTTIKPAQGGAPEISRFSTIYVKLDGQWLQSAVRDEIARDLSPHDHLMELEWLLGEWVNESEDAIVSTTCKWATGGNFIDREFTMKTKGRPVLSGTQRIGWDPLKRQYKTWIFDSLGGHGEGYWTRNGNQWLIKVDGVSHDGQPASATNIITRLNKDRLSWQSVDRTLGGATLPGVDEFVVVRKPPEIGK